MALDGVRGVVFGGDPSSPGPRPQLLVDYTHGGCAGIVVADSAEVTIQHIIVDALRLPFTVGMVVSATESAVAFAPEIDPADRAGVYRWDTARYAWLNTTDASAVVPPGARATRELKEARLSNTRYSSTVDPDGVVRLAFAAADPALAQLEKGSRIFLKHFSNMESWGYYGFNASGVQIVGVRRCRAPRKSQSVAYVPAESSILMVVG